MFKIFKIFKLVSPVVTHRLMRRTNSNPRYPVPHTPDVSKDEGFFIRFFTKALLAYLMFLFTDQGPIQNFGGLIPQFTADLGSTTELLRAQRVFFFLYGQWYGEYIGSMMGDYVLL